MNVSECMSRDVQVCSPDASLRDAARAMKQTDSGFLPVGEEDHLIGMVTDRDIAVRGLAEGKGPDSAVREIMTRETCYCFEDEGVGVVARQMGGLQIRRMPVVDRGKRLMGVVSLGDISRAGAGGVSFGGQALSDIVEAGEAHQQT